MAPADPALRIAAGNLELVRGDMTRAIDLYRQAVVLDPLNPRARSYLAFNLALAGQLAEARAEFPRVVELNPAAPWAHAGLGLAFLIEGKFEEAAVTAQDDAAEWARLLIVATARWSQKRIPESDAALALVNRRPSLIRRLTRSPRSTRIAETRTGRSSGSSARAGSATGAWPACGGILLLGEPERGPALECILAHDGPGRRPTQMSALDDKANT